MNSETKAADAAKVVPEGNIVKLPLDKLQPFRNHAFKLYEGQKLTLFVQSICQNGIIQPLIVRPIKESGQFEIISGHNRAKAAEQAGLTEVPAVVRELTDDETVILANETNITQRSFKTWDHSEKANSIFQYHEALKRQGNRTDLASDTSGGNSQKSEESNARKVTARVYGETEYTIRLYLELYRLIEPLKTRLDDGEFGVTAAQRLAYISLDGQALINDVLEEEGSLCEITIRKSISLRKELKDYTGDDLSDAEKASTKEKIREILTIDAIPVETEESPSEFEMIAFPKNQYDLLFLNKTPGEVIDEIIEAVQHHHELIEKSFKKQSRATKTP